MVRLDGVFVVEDGPAALPGDGEFTLEGELSDLVEADAEVFGGFEGGDLVGHGVCPFVFWWRNFGCFGYVARSVSCWFHLTQPPFLSSFVRSFVRV